MTQVRDSAYARALKITTGWKSFPCGGGANTRPGKHRIIITRNMILLKYRYCSTVHNRRACVWTAKDDTGTSSSYKARSNECTITFALCSPRRGTPVYWYYTSRDSTGKGSCAEEAPCSRNLFKNVHNTWTRDGRCEQYVVTRVGTTRTARLWIGVSLVVVFLPATSRPSLYPLLFAPATLSL